MAKPQSISVDLSSLPVSGIELVKVGYKQKVRSHIQRWQDLNDPDKTMRFEVKKVLQGYVIIRVE
jgi:hypothetical protein